jgi:hypothetical protein
MIDGTGLTLAVWRLVHHRMRTHIRTKAARPPTPPIAPPMMTPFLEGAGVGDGVTLVEVFVAGVAVEVASEDDLDFVDVVTAVRGTGPT